MPEEVLYFTFIAMVSVTMINVVCAINYMKSKKFCEKYRRELIDCLFEDKKRFWKRRGAYEAPEGNRLYLDLEGGIRLVISEGEIEGWYKRD